MKINIELINPTPEPIRKTWDENKLDELGQSILEQGLIVPIKVRPIHNIPSCSDHGLDWLNDCQLDIHNESELCFWCEEYRGEYRIEHEWEDDFKDSPTSPIFEVVYGHRRLLACRHAMLTEIEAIVEGVDDTNVLVQALIENVVREDMNDADKGDALQLLKEATGKTWTEIGAMFGHGEAWARRLATITDGEKNIMVVTGDGIGIRHIEEARAGSDNQEDAEMVLQKSADEGLTVRQTRQVADSIAATKDPRRRDALLDTPYSSFIHDPEINRERAEKYGESDPLTYDREPSPGDVFEMTVEVKMIVDYLKTSTKQMTQEVLKMYSIGKFSPEAVPFVVREAKKMVQAWQNVIDELEV